ncbi:MAG TPA: HPF/RaiA family ribosome-associated protein [Vicinamibacteria bacterium]|nr:HPF/RaiA family ribosome-associated protein [Vicinamibacteria bacterium]
MEHRVQITCRGFDPTEALERAVEEKANKLETFFDKIESCHVTMEAPHRHHRKGNLYHLRVRLTVPGEEIVVSHDPPEHAQNEDIYLVVNDAFKETARRLEDYVRRRRGKVKHHVGPLHARVARLFPEEGYGFLETADGREIYFHENSVLDGAFGQLEVGTEVRFAEEQGEKGPQASTVTVVGR